jgi:rhodanese-related sulfurtransferase
MTRKIDAPSLKTMINDGKELALLDVREHGQYGEGHMLMAVSIPYSVLESEIDARVPRRSVRMVLVDGGDGVAERAAARLTKVGYTDVAILEGGVDAWEKAGYVIFKGENVLSKAFGEVVEHACHTPSISADELQAMFDAKDDIIVLDSRTPEEFKRMSIPNGINVPGAELAYRVHDLVPSPDTLVVVNCAGRTRSIIGAQSLINAGIPNKVVALRGGTQGWVLSGRKLAHDASATFGTLTEDGKAKAKKVMASVRQRYGVKTVDRATLAKWRGETDTRTLHIVDVRSQQEYAAGHLPGSIWVPGGQLVQAADRWIGTRGARVVLVDDNEVRATMTAHWMVQMRWDVYVLEGGVGSDATDTSTPKRKMLGAEDYVIDEVSPKELKAALDAGDAVAVDIDVSTLYREGHIPGAVWAIRPRIADTFAKLPKGKKIVLYSEHETRARLAVPDAKAAAGGTPVALLTGGREAWKKAGLPVEAGPGTPPDSECLDFLFFVHDRHHGNQDSMRAYLAWEEQLPAQIAADGDAQYKIPGA